MNGLPLADSSGVQGLFKLQGIAGTFERDVKSCLSPLILNQSSVIAGGGGTILRAKKSERL
jgi:shikimate kinase